MKKKFTLAIVLLTSTVVAAKEIPMVCFGSKVVITKESFEKEFEQLLEENPHLISVLHEIPDAKNNFLAGMINQMVVDTWIIENKIDKKTEYQIEMNRMMNSVKRMLNTKYFGLQHSVQVTSAEIAEFYEKNKDSMPDLIISHGGIKAVGVSFHKKADAKKFLAKVNKTKNIKKTADAAKVSENFCDFKVVNAQRLDIYPELRDKIIATIKVPSVEIIHIGKTFWVISATEKVDTRYRSLEQVKDGLEKYISKEKRMKLLDTEITRLKTGLNIVVSEDVLLSAKI
ncbi:MAG: peptidylprolyl isomerase [Candidatus Babeliales bacterium]|nr:peptidylprolyl isomerase [Candidatus Babeliales bacterium]